MAEKKEITILVNPHTGAEHEFEAAHAARIMARADAGGWEYKEEPKKKTAKDAGKRRSTKAAATEAQAPEGDCGCS